MTEHKLGHTQLRRDTAQGEAGLGNRSRADSGTWTSRVFFVPLRVVTVLVFAWGVVVATVSCAHLSDSELDGFRQEGAPTVSPAPTTTSRLNATQEREGRVARPTASADRPASAASPTVVSTPNVGAGRELRVANTGGDGVYLRRAPAMGEPLQILAEGAVVAVVGPSREVDGRSWQQVQVPDGTVGWVAAEFLVVPDRPVALATPSAAPTPPPPTAVPTGSAAVEVRGEAYVGNTGGEGVYLRRTPVMADRVVAWPDGTRLEILGDETWSDGRTWRLVRDPSGNVGWVPTAYLVLAGAAPSNGIAPVIDEKTYVFAQRWPGAIAYCISAASTPPPLTPAQFVAAVDSAFSLWQAATGGAIPLVNRGECESDPTNLRDGRNTIGWESMTEAGVTSVRYNGPRIVEADVLINRNLARRRDARECLSYVVTHELGHFLGLAHASPRLESVMTEGGGRCRTIEQLPEDDVRNIRLLYPLPVR